MGIRKIFRNLQYNHLIELIFLDENYQLLFLDWKDKVRELLSPFRLSFSKEFENETVIDFVESMKKRSSFFAECWNEHKIMDESPFSKTTLYQGLNKLSFDFSSLHYIDGNKVHLNLFINIPSDDGVTEKTEGNQKIKL